MTADLPALTLKTPWAYAVTDLGKALENRTWRPPGALVGHRFAIHAGKVPALGSREAWVEIKEAVWWMDSRSLIPKSKDKKFTQAELVRRGSAIVALATLGGVVTESDSPWFVGPFGWQLADVFVLPKPVPCRGAQRLWTVPPDVAARVLAQEPRP